MPTAKPTPMTRARASLTVLLTFCCWGVQRGGASWDDDMLDQLHQLQSKLQRQRPTSGPPLSLPRLLESLQRPLTLAPPPSPMGNTVWRRRRQQGASSAVLTMANTRPLRIHADLSALYEETAVPHASCFHVGQWFRWNFPTRKVPPVPGSPDDFEYCDRSLDPAGQNCWAQCEAADVLTPGMRTWMIDKVLSATREVERYLRVPVAGGASADTPPPPLRFAVGRGEWHRLYEQLGEDTSSACAKDAALMYRLPINASLYCETGVAADAVFMPVMAQYSPGVAGWGTDVMREQATGRPLFLMMGWSVPSTAEGRQRDDLTGEWRRTVVHEIIHGLGFTIQQFRDAGAVELRMLAEYDSPAAAAAGAGADGSGSSSEDEVWVATGPRVVAVGRQYYNCPELSGVPLMGLNPLGPGSRGSHWETRLMADEIMAYGRGDAVSAFTLALLEELGFYLANYSAASCMAWGRAQVLSFTQSTQARSLPTHGRCI